MTDVFSRIEAYSRPTAKDRDLGKAAGISPQEVISKKSPSQRFIDNLVDKGFHLDELETIFRTKGHQLIIACAGAGKTTGLVFKIIYDGITGELLGDIVDVNGTPRRLMSKVWVSTFLRTGAQDLRRSMNKWQSTLSTPNFASTVKFSTMHAEFKSLLESLGVEVSIIDSKENTSLLRKVVRGYNLGLNAEELKSFESALSYSRNRLDKQKYVSDIYQDKGIVPAVIDAVLVDWAMERRKAKKMDFEDLQDLLYGFLYVNVDQRVVDAVTNRFDFIYVDEFQDTSQKQYAILKKYAEGCKKIIVIGDDDQTIYTWRGSSNDIIKKIFPNDFKPTINTLSRNYRCPSGILDPIIPSIEKNEGRYAKPIKSANEGGKLRVGTFNSYSEMTKALEKCIEQDITDGLSVAVLCRTNVDGLVPALMLDKHGHKWRFSLSGKDMTLDSYIGKRIVSILSLVTARGGDNVKQALGQLVYDRREPAMVADECKSSRVRIWDLDPEELIYSAPNLAPHILRWMEWYAEGFRGVELAQRLLDYYERIVFKRNTSYNETAVSVIKAIRVLAERESYEDIEDFIYDVKSINERLVARMGTDANSADITIATVHEYKGKESDSVYIWNDSEKVFPHFRSDDIEEERRLHYIACTRAKKLSTIIAREGALSPFVREMDLSTATVVRPTISITF